MKSFYQTGAVLLAAAAHCQAVDLDVTNQDSIRSAASTIAHGLMSYYTGNVTNTTETIGVLPQPYYWWEAGAMWGAMLDYYHLTGDSSYNDVTSQALMSQMGPAFDYMVPAHQKDEGNDDQSFWGFATMSAAEKNYPQPSTGGYTWLQLTENLWNTQAARWDNSTCGGGLRWQIFSSNKGYDYKNSIANGAFFQLSARLARFTGNSTYLDWAQRSFAWSQSIGLIDSNYYVYDGAGDEKNCSEITRVVWTYNSGVYLYGAAVLYNHTGSSQWATHTQGFMNASSFFINTYNNATNVMYEPACETVNTCDNDQFSFKGYLSRFMWAATLMAPSIKSAATTFLTASAEAAAKACSGQPGGNTCGQHWYWATEFDGRVGVGQQMSALETIQGLLVPNSAPPLRSNDIKSS